MIEEQYTAALQVEFENTVCPNCAFAENKSIYTFTDKFGSYNLVCCKFCQLSYLNPRPTKSTIGIYYEGGQYTPFLSSGSGRSLFGRVYTVIRKYSVRWKREKIERFRAGHSILDIGCGTGEFLSEMQSNGWTSYGLEPSPEASEFARKTYHLEIETGFIDHKGPAFSISRFDVITMWHVLEHVHKPLEALNRVRALLAADGLLIIALPNVSSFDAGAYKENWVALDVPRHLLHFTPDTLKSILHKAGMEIVNQHQMPLDTVFNCLMSEKKIMENVPWYTIPFFLLRMKLLILISWIVGMNDKRGSSVMYYVRKTKA
ncbi:class I SAM-dependent methyltransferase [bacterium]|nr:class I SAM-dependent methyltransferase [bacterium]